MTSGAVVVDLDQVAAAGTVGAAWSLPHGGDLDANVVRLDAAGGIGEHVNNEVDVLVVVVSGQGSVSVDGAQGEAAWARGTSASSLRWGLVFSAAGRERHPPARKR